MSDNKTQTVKLFDESGGAMIAAQSDAAAVARATQEIQAALVIAQRFQRDEVRSKARILQACQRKELAEVAEYEYSRGGTRITGPTIDLLRAIANRWGNIRYGWTEVSREPATQISPGRSMVRCFAWDMQSNGQAERTFAINHWRDTQAGGYVLDDERDIYELIANQAARRVRACLEEVIDADIVNAAVDQCRVTLKTGEKIPLKDRAVQMVTAFAEFGVTQPMIETRLGNKLDAVSENQLASLRRIYKALKDGVGRREDYFKSEAAKPQFDNAPSAGDPTTKQAEPATPVASPETQQPAAATPAPAPATPAAEPAIPAVPAGAFNPLRGVRNLAKMSRIKESELLDFLATIGKTDGSAGTLEDLMLSANGPAIMLQVAEEWPDLVAKMKGRTE